MAKKPLFGDIAANIRKAARRRIARLERVKEHEANQVIAKGAEKRIASIKRAMEGTYTYSTTTGKKLKRTDKQKTAALVELSRELRETQYVASERAMRSNKTTQHELNAASAGAASVYTEAEAKIFYRATQKAWQREGVSLKERNNAILEYYGYERLSDIVSDVLNANTGAIQSSRINPEEELTEEQEELVDEENDLSQAQSYPRYLSQVIAAPDPSGLSELSKA